MPTILFLPASLMNKKVSHPSEQPHGEVDVVEDQAVAEVVADEVVAEEVVLQVVNPLDKAVILLANPQLVLANLFVSVLLRWVTIL